MKKEKKTMYRFSYSKNEEFLQSINLSINLLFLKSDFYTIYLPTYLVPFLIHFNINISIFSAQVTAKYFEQLSDEDINKIYTVYEDDFKLFDYTFTFRNISLPSVDNLTQ